MELQAYKFETTVLENGLIQIPDFMNYINQEVEIFVVLKPIQKEENKKKITTSEFIKKWAGFLTITNTEDSKYQYLIEKYKLLI